ncbi:transglutaminase-like domain-containing protein [Vibrio sp. Isolate33]|uniref:transglutaminase-like domain-containing protein n=1 Tax=Vibrio sp. Isolate33 TaxID=2908539 RepID=UPI001EFEEC4D|nr:transglutaminase-like domain-containing protein [Vibrio sp. Isolate33]MCG9544050.1 transglutaminase-like domain-containing protein [Vibrio sp. Isolate33]
MVINDYIKNTEFTEIPNDLLDISKVPDDIVGICKFVQGNLIHSYWLEHYGVEAEPLNKLKEMQTRHAKDLVSLAISKSGEPAHVFKKPNHRVISICRDFSLLVCSILRAKGVPTRLRSGFATYLEQNHFEDHWVCEYWNKDKGWIAVDAQLDDIHHQILQFEFDPCDVPSSNFIVAGQAWRLCRQNLESADSFGFRDFKGLEFIKGSLIRDLYALSKFEMHTWDTGWGILPKFISPISGEYELTLLDELAEVSFSADGTKALKLVKSCNEIKLPSGWDCSKFPTLSELYASL